MILANAVSFIHWRPNLNQSISCFVFLLTGGPTFPTSPKSPPGPRDPCSKTHLLDSTTVTQLIGVICVSDNYLQWVHLVQHPKKTTTA